MFEIICTSISSALQLRTESTAEGGQKEVETFEKCF